jgi:hypothetical protein
MMKNSLFTLALLALCSLPVSLFATTWTVSNNAERPAQFTSIQEAVNAASPNDTILITGGVYSSTAGTMTTTIPLVFYGEGIRGNEGFPKTTISSGSFNFRRFNSGLSASGSRVYGIEFQFSGISIDADFSGALAGQETMSDFIFERCTFISSSSATVSINVRDGISDVTVRNCLFNGGEGLTTSGNGNLLSNIVYTNNVHSSNDDYFKGIYNGNVVVRNSIFLNNVSPAFEATQLVLENNIFYRSEPSGCNTCTFNNNLTYLANDNTLPYGNNLGSGNIEGQNPLFASFPALGAGFDWNQSYELLPGSPALGTGTNGIDMGINSGNAPVTQLPEYAKIPAVTNLEIPVSSVPVGGTLQINVEAISRD